MMEFELGPTEHWFDGTIEINLKALRGRASQGSELMVTVLGGRINLKAVVGHGWRRLQLECVLYTPSWLAQ